MVPTGLRFLSDLGVVELDELLLEVIDVLATCSIDPTIGASFERGLGPL